MANALEAQLLARVAGAGPRRIAVAMANNAEVIASIGEAIRRQVAEFVLIGPRDAIVQTADDAGVDISDQAIVESSDAVTASRAAAGMASDGSVQVVMKGLVQTADFVRAVLDRSFGLVPPGGLLSHVAAINVPTYHKTFLLTDAAITVSPSVEEKIKLIRNAVRISSTVCADRPKIACVAPVENVSENVPSTVEAFQVVERANADASLNVLADGPFGFDVAVSAEAASIKGIDSEVAGDADIILVPGIDAGNVLYKSVSILARGSVAGVVAGARVPVVLTSRADTEETKLCSILLAIASAF